MNVSSKTVITVVLIAAAVTLIVTHNGDWLFAIFVLGACILG